MSKKSYADVQVMDLNFLDWLAKNKRSVYCPPWAMVFWLQKPKPASVIINMQGACILRLMRKGLFVYEKGK